MTVACQMSNCPCNRLGFCGKGLTAIDSNGMCEVFWKNGQRRDPKQVLGDIGVVDDFAVLNVVNSKEKSNG